MIVWLASYPRSGNTLLRMLLHHTFGVYTCSAHNDDATDIGADPTTAKIVGHQDRGEDFQVSAARASDELHFIKTHAPPNGQLEAEDRIIYILRDGRESSLSFCRYLQDIIGREVALANIFDGTIGKALTGGNWASHVRAWDAATRPDTLLLRYEDLVADQGPCIEQLVEFTGLKPQAVDLPSFEQLQEINPRFFRSGKTNSWRETLTPEQHLHFWNRSWDMMVRFGYCQDVPADFVTTLCRVIDEVPDEHRSPLLWSPRKDREVDIKRPAPQRRRHRWKDWLSLPQHWRRAA